MANRRRKSFSVTLVLHDAIFLATCLATLEKEIHCKLQKTCYTLQSRAATFNLFRISSMQSLQKVKPSSTLCNCCKPKKCEAICKEGMLHAATYLQLFSQRHCNISCKEHRVTPAVALDSTSCNNYRDFLKPLQVAARDCNW